MSQLLKDMQGIYDRVSDISDLDAEWRCLLLNDMRSVLKRVEELEKALIDALNTIYKMPDASFIVNVPGELQSKTTTIHQIADHLRLALSPKPQHDTTQATTPENG